MHTVHPYYIYVVAVDLDCNLESIQNYVLCWAAVIEINFNSLRMLVIHCIRIVYIYRPLIQPPFHSKLGQGHYSQGSSCLHNIYNIYAARS